MLKMNNSHLKICESLCCILAAFVSIVTCTIFYETAWTITPTLFLGSTFGIAYKQQYQRQMGKRREGGGWGAMMEIKHNT
jgi:hypothetical protein